MKKKNDDSKTFADWTIKKLKDEARYYDDLINKIGCYGTKDIRNLMAIEDELARRGVEVIKTIDFN